MSKENISKHITYREATNSATAKRYKIANDPNEEQLANMRYLAEKVFEPLRAWYGKPIYVTSFFRTLALNVYLKGAKNSQHCKGEAIDIDTPANRDNAALFRYIRQNLEFDQLIWEYGDNTNPDWVHVSIRRDGKNRKEVLRVYKTRTVRMK